MRQWAMRMIKWSNWTSRVAGEDHAVEDKNGHAGRGRAVDDNGEG